MKYRSSINRMCVWHCKLVPTSTHSQCKSYSSSIHVPWHGLVRARTLGPVRAALGQRCIRHVQVVLLVRPWVHAVQRLPTDVSGRHGHGGAAQCVDRRTAHVVVVVVRGAGGRRDCARGAGGHAGVGAALAVQAIDGLVIVVARTARSVGRARTCQCDGTVYCSACAWVRYSSKGMLILSDAHSTLCTICEFVTHLESLSILWQRS